MNYPAEPCFDGLAGSGISPEKIYVLMINQARIKAAGLDHGLFEKLTDQYYKAKKYEAGSF